MKESCGANIASFWILQAFPWIHWMLGTVAWSVTRICPSVPSSRLFTRVVSRNPCLFTFLVSHHEKYKCGTAVNNR